MGRPVLVADFDFTRRWVIAHVLRQAGCEVTEVGDADAAEAELRRKSFAAAFVAVRLEGCNSFELCRRWTREGVPIVLVSTDFRVSEELRGQAHEAGAAAQLSSTVDRDHIVAVINRLLGEKRLSG